MEFPDSLVIKDAAHALPDPAGIEFSPGTGCHDPCIELRGERLVKPVRDDIRLPATVFCDPSRKSGHVRQPGLCTERPRGQFMPFHHIQILLRISI
jgi:hypothetical protein